MHSNANANTFTILWRLLNAHSNAPHSNAHSNAFAFVNTKVVDTKLSNSPVLVPGCQSKDTCEATTCKV